MSVDLKDLNLSTDLTAQFEKSLKHILEHKDTITRLCRQIEHFEHAIDGQAKNLDGSIERQARDLVERARLLINICRRGGNAAFAPYALAAVDQMIKDDDKIDFANTNFELSHAIFLEVIRIFNLDQDLDHLFDESA